MSHAAKSRSYLQCVYWIAVFLLGAVVTVPSLIGIVIEYRRYPVITKSLLSHSEVAEFPAITLCGLNR